LGAGKISAILQLLKHKSADQRWAILINEFFEVEKDSINDGNVSISPVIVAVICSHKVIA